MVTSRIYRTNILRFTVLFCIVVGATCKQRTQAVLLFVPTHAAEQEDSFREFANCLLRVNPWETEGQKVKVDLLVVQSGPCDSRSCLHDLREQVAEVVKEVGYLRSGATEHVATSTGNYDKTRQSTSWNEGPNNIFYNATMPGGHVFDKFSRLYTYLIQLETDVCAAKHGWLDALLAPMHDRRVVVSGASLVGKCVASETRPGCFSASRMNIQGVQYHVNGNAAYRLGPRLASLLETARTSFTEHSFDLAIWLAAGQLNLGSAVYNNDRVYNVHHPVGSNMSELGKMLPTNTVLAHVPWRFRLGTAQLGEWCHTCYSTGDPDCRARPPLSTVCQLSN